MRHSLLLLAFLSVCSAASAGMLVKIKHCEQRVKPLNNDSAAVVSGDFHGVIGVMFRRVKHGTVKFDKKNSAIETPEGKKLTLSFEKQKGVAESWRGKPKGAGLIEGEYKFHLHFTVDGKKHSFEHAFNMTIDEIDEDAIITKNFDGED